MTSSSEEPSIQRPREGFFGFHLGAEERGLVQSLAEVPRVPLGPHSGALGLPGRVYNSSLPASQFPEAWEMDLRVGESWVRASAPCWSPEVAQVPKGGSALSSERRAAGQRQRLSSLRTWQR